MPKALFAGPWVGEFGWELFGWQGYLRKMSKNYEKVYICGRPGHEALYKDFCTEYIEDPTLPIGATSSYKLKGYNPTTNQLHLNYPQNNLDIVRPSLLRNVPQDFIKFGETNKKYQFDLILHSRATTKHRTNYRNWPINKWSNLISKLPKSIKIASIGTTNAANLVEGSVDLRDIPLDELILYLYNSKLLIGPSSGPMHLGSLCGTKHIVWTGKGNGVINNKTRYEKVWNPLNTPVKIIEETNWNPSVDTVLKAIKTFGNL